MEIKVTKNRLAQYLKKRNLTKEEYTSKDNVSIYLFFADREDWGTDQLVMQIQHPYDEDFGSMNDLENISKDLFHRGFRNIRIEQKKKYYKKMYSCPVMLDCTMVVYEYKYI